MSNPMKLCLLGYEQQPKSKSNTTIRMAENSNETAQIQKMLEKMQTRMNESDKKI